MAQFKNVSGEDRTVPAIGDRLVIAGAVITVPDATAEGFACQPDIWQAVVTTTKKADPKAAESSEEN